MNARHLLTSLFLTAALAAPAAASPPGSSVVVDQPDGFTDPLTGAGADSQTDVESVSGNGRYVVFTSRSDGLSDLDDNRFYNVFRKDRVTGAVELVSIADDGRPLDSDSGAPRISEDGTRVAFTSSASNLGPGAEMRVYVRDFPAGRTRLVSRRAGPDGAPVPASDPSISGDGNAIAFVTSHPIDQGDTNSRPDVYLRRLNTDETIWVSRYATGSPAGKEESYQPSVDRLGNRVAFTTLTGFAGSSDFNNSYDVYLKDVGTGALSLISWKETNKAAADGHSGQPAISPDGGAVAFRSMARNLDTSAPDGADADIYVRHTGSAEITLASGGIYGGAARDSADPDVVGPPTDLRVAFATEVGGSSQVGIRTLADGRYETVSAAGAVMGDAPSTHVSLAASDPTVAFSTRAGNLGAGIGGDHEDAVARTTSGFELIGGGSAGPLAEDLAGVQLGAGVQRITPDGRYAVFTSGSDGLGVADRADHLFRRDLRTGRTVLIDRGADGAPSETGAYDGAISADGARVAFATDDRLVAADANDHVDVYVRDVAAGTTTLVSRTPTGAAGNEDSGDPALDADGDRIAFTSGASDLSLVTDLNATTDVFVHDLERGTNELASRAAVAGDGESLNAVLSADGGRVVFQSAARNLVPAVDPDAKHDIYSRDLADGRLRVVSVRTGGTKEAAYSFSPTVTADGNRVAFSSEARLDAADADDVGDIYVHDIAAATTTLASRATGAGGAKGDGTSYFPQISADGAAVAFVSDAANLGGPAGGTFVRRFGDNTTTPVAAGVLGGLTNGGACALIATPRHPILRSSADFRRVVFTALTDACEVFTSEPVDGAGGDGGDGGDGSGAKQAPVLSGLSVRGKRVRFQLDRPAKVTLRVKGRGAVRRDGVAGRNRVRMPKRWTRRPGRYRIVARARDGALVSAPRRARFTVKPR